MHKLLAALVFVFVTLSAASARADGAHVGTDAPETPIAPKCEGEVVICPNGQIPTCGCPEIKVSGDTPKVVPSQKGKPGKSNTATVPGATAEATGGNGGSVGNITVNVTIPPPAVQEPIAPPPQATQQPLTAPPSGDTTSDDGDGGLRLSRIGFGVGLGFHCNGWDPGPGCGGQALLSLEIGLRTGKKLEIVLRPDFGWEVEKERKNPYMYGGDVVLLYGPSPPKDGWAIQFGGGLGTNRFLDRAPEPADGPSAVRGWDVHLVPEFRLASQELFVGLSGTLGVGETNWQENGQGLIRHVVDVSGGAMIRLGGHLSFF